MLNGDGYFTFLKYLRKITAPSSKKTVVLADRAPYHRARVHKDWRDACSDRFSQELLPPYSPELNSIERVWKFTRRTCTHNRYFPATDDIVAVVEPQFDQWRHRSEALKRLCAIT